LAVIGERERHRLEQTRGKSTASPSQVMPLGLEIVFVELGST